MRTRWSVSSASSRWWGRTVADRDEYLTINGVDLALDGAWHLVDPTPFLAKGRMRGRDRAVPGVDGMSARPRVLGPLNVVASLRVFGVKDENGDTHSDRRIGLRDNIGYLTSNLLPPYGASDTATIVHTFSDGSTRSATCIVNELTVVSTFEFAAGRAAVLAMDVTVLEGELSDDSAPS